jgi:hypothetical protein
MKIGAARQAAVSEINFLVAFRSAVYNVFVTGWHPPDHPAQEPRRKETVSSCRVPFLLGCPALDLAAAGEHSRRHLHAGPAPPWAADFESIVLHA